MTAAEIKRIDANLKKHKESFAAKMVEVVEKCKNDYSYLPELTEIRDILNCEDTDLVPDKIK
jgi:hypothetical protein